MVMDEIDTCIRIMDDVMLKKNHAEEHMAENLVIKKMPPSCGT